MPAINKNRFNIPSAALIVFLFLIPVAIFWYNFRYTPAVTVNQSLNLLRGIASPYTLVDVRPAAVYAAGHVAGAVNWPLGEIRALSSIKDVPEQFRKGNLLLIGDGGFGASAAARSLAELTVPNVSSVLGGMQWWTAQRVVKETEQFGGLTTDGKSIGAFQRRTLSTGEQALGFIAPFIIRPLFCVLAFIFFIYLRGERGAGFEPLRRSLAFFFLAGLAGVLDRLLYRAESFGAAYVQSACTVAAISLAALAALEALDARVLRFTVDERTCAMEVFCRGCRRLVPGFCRGRQLLLALLPFFGALCFLPLSMQVFPVSYNANVFGSLAHYSHPVPVQCFESGYAPVAALFLFTLAWFAIWSSRRELVGAAMLLVSFGLGFLGFALTRLLLFHGFHENLAWFFAWEDLLGLLSMLAVMALLWVRYETGR